MNSKDIMNFTISEAKRLGADQVEIFSSKSEYTYYSSKNSEIQNVETSTSNTFNISLFQDGRFMSVSTKDLRPAEITDFLKKNLSMIKFLDVDSNRALPEKKFMDKKITSIEDIYDSSIKQIDPQSKLEMALKLSRYLSKKSSAIFSNETFYYDTATYNYYANSEGYFRESNDSKFTLGGSAYVKDGEKIQRSWWGAQTTFFKDITSIESIGNQVAKRAIEKKGARPKESGVYDIITENNYTSNLLKMVTDSTSGNYLDQKQSFLMNMKGAKIASKLLTIESDPFIAKGLGSTSFYKSGIPANKLTLIKNGILENFIIDHYYSKKLNMSMTVPELSNVVIKGNHTLEEMIKSTKKGIYITGFIGGNFNSLTGDYSKGIDGFFIDNGEITFPINEMNLSGNLLTTMKNITMVGNNYYQYSSWRAPSILIKDATLSGKS